MSSVATEPDLCPTDGLSDCAGDLHANLLSALRGRAASPRDRYASEQSAEIAFCPCDERLRCYEYGRVRPDNDAQKQDDQEIAQTLAAEQQHRKDHSASRYART